MSFDDRIDKLRERREALAQSVGMLLAGSEEQRKRTEEQGKNIDKMLRLVEIDADNIRSLARIAEAHDHRISGLGGS
jgi:hypothetical protein